MLSSNPTSKSLLSALLLSSDTKFSTAPTSLLASLPPSALLTRRSSSAVASPKPKQAGGRSPSTVRRQLGQAERELAAASERRDAVAAEMANAVDHREMGAIGERLARAQEAVDAAEEAWLALADEAESLGLEL